MDEAAVFSASFHRANLHIAARAKEGETQELLDFLRDRTGQAGIIYCGSRAKTERVAQRLEEKGMPAAGSMPACRRWRSGSR